MGKQTKKPREAVMYECEKCGEQKKMVVFVEKK